MARYRSVPRRITAAPAATAAPPTTYDVALVSDDATKAELVELARSRGLNTSGTKAELRARLGGAE